MRLKICTCSEKPEEVLVLNEEEKELFHNDSDCFLNWLNKEIEREKIISSNKKGEADLDEAIEMLKNLQEIFEEIRNNKRKKYEN